MRRKLMAAVLVLAMAPMTFVGCHGSFPMTKAVYNMNSNVESPVMRQIVFWIFMPVVSGVAAGGDAFVMNVLEFWTGGGGGLASVTLDDGTEVALAPGSNAWAE